MYEGFYFDFLFICICTINFSFEVTKIVNIEINTKKSRLAAYLNRKIRFSMFNYIFILYNFDVLLYVIYCLHEQFDRTLNF